MYLEKLMTLDYLGSCFCFFLCFLLLLALSPPAPELSQATSLSCWSDCAPILATMPSSSLTKEESSLRYVPWALQVTRITVRLETAWHRNCRDSRLH